MGERKDNKEYIWVVPLIGGILTLIGLVTPAASVSVPIFGTSMQTWMWGLFSFRTYDLYEGYISVTQFTESPVELIISILATLIVLVGALGLLSSANTSKKLGFSKQKGVVPSILLIIGTLIWIIGFEIYTQSYTGVSFWQVMGPGFGVIAPFLGAIFSLIGYAAAKMSPKQPPEPITSMKTDFVKPQPVVQTSHSFKFCPTCGEQIVEDDQQFCINCGYNLKSFGTKVE